MRKVEANTKAEAGHRVLLPALILAALTRFFHLGYQSVWGDEALTLQVYSAGNSLAEVLSNIWEHAFHPPLYFAVVHLWYRLSDSECMLRLPSALFGLAAVPLAYALAGRLFGRGTAGVSALVVALSPIHIWYSQEARMYSLELLLCLASTLYFVKAWGSRRARDIGLYALFTTLALFTHMGAVLLLAAQAAFVLGASMRNRRQAAVWVGVQAVVILAFLPWALRFAAANRTESGMRAIGYERGSSLWDVGYGLYTFSVGYSLGPPVAELHRESPLEALSGHLPAILLSASAFGVLVILGLLRAYRVNRQGFWIIAAHLFVPLVLAGGASLLPGLPLNPRYMLVAVIPYWLAVALGVQTCAHIRYTLPVAIAATLVTGFSLYNHYFEPAYAKQDMRSAAAFVAGEATPSDVILISSVELGGPFLYYFKRKDVPFHGYPPRAGLVNARRLPEDMRKLTNGRNRAWLVLGRTWSSDPHGSIPAYFDARCKAIERRRFSGVSVDCYLLR